MFCDAAFIFYMKTGDFNCFILSLDLIIGCESVYFVPIHTSKGETCLYLGDLSLGEAELLILAAVASP